MSDVVIAGVGQYPVGEHWNVSLRSLAAKAILAARKDAGGLKPQALYVGNLLAPTLSHQQNLGALLVDNTGLDGIEACTTEAAGASGAAAFRLGYLAVASGFIDVALVVGVEKYTDMVGPEVEGALAETTDYDYEAVQGLTLAAQAALLMQRYMHEYQAPRRAFADFPLLAHANAASNPNAMFRRPISREAYERAELVSDPLNLFDIAPYADGAAAVILTHPELVPPQVTHRLVRVRGSGLVIDTLALHDRPDPLAFEAARLSVERACRQAGVLPSDVDLFELCDAFSIYAVLSLEAAGFAERGQGWKLAQGGELGLKGKLPISTLGGLKGRGNPLGATGVYQIVEAALQLRREAGPNQVTGARRALVQSLGGPAATAVTHVLES
jgi:acetyl-CoA C-acetyltransferase